LKQQRYDEAITALSEATALEPDRAELQSHLFRAYRDKWRALLRRDEFEKEFPKIRSDIEGLLAAPANREINLRLAITGCSLLADDEARDKLEKIYLAEFPEAEFASEIFHRRIIAEKDAQRKVYLIEGYLARFPRRQSPDYLSLLFRHYAGREDSPADRLVSLGEASIKAHAGLLYARVNMAATVATVLAERQIALDRAQAIIDEAWRLAESLKVGDAALRSEAGPQAQESFIKFLKERASTTRGFVLLRRRKADEAALGLTAGLQRVIGEVEQRGIILWKDADLRQIGVRPHVLWLAELYEAQKDYARAARYLLAGYTDSERINSYIRERLSAVYREMKFDESRAINDLKKAEQAYGEMQAAIEKTRDDEKLNWVAKRSNLPAPDFKLTLADKSVVELKELKGKVVVLNFWSSWCGPCVAEMPHFQKAVDRYAKTSEVIFLAVSLDDNRQAARSFIERHSYRLSVAYDNGAAVSYNATSIPATVIIDRKGMIQFRDSGFGGAGEIYVERLSRRIDELLKEPAAPAEKVPDGR
jgi:peroxiredoxin